MYEDLKGYRQIGGKKNTPSPGWGILVFSHVMILVLGISLGYWVGGHFPKEPAEEAGVSPQAEPEKVTASRSRSATAKGASGGSLTREKDAEKEAQKQGDAGFTFYEALSEETTPARDRETKARGSLQEVPQKGLESVSPRKKTNRKPDDLSYYVQVASFRDKEKAQSLRDRLKGKGYRALVVPAVVKNKGIWYRVRLGPFRDREKAAQRARIVARGENLHPVIVAEGGGQNP